MFAVGVLAFLMQSPAEIQGVLAEDPTAPARSGMLFCEDPDHTTRTCAAINRYRFEPDGSFFEETSVLVAENPSIKMLTRIQMRQIGLEVCGSIEASYLQQLRFETNGEPVANERTTALRSDMARGMRWFFGKSICTRVYRDGTADHNRIFVDGVEEPALSNSGEWIESSANYGLRYEP